MFNNNQEKRGIITTKTTTKKSKSNETTMSLSPLKHHQNYLTGMPFSVSDILHPALENQFNSTSSKTGFGGYATAANNPSINSYYKSSPAASGSESQYSSIYYNNIQHSNGGSSVSGGTNGGSGKLASSPSTGSSAAMAQQQPPPPSSCTPSPSIHSPTGGLNSTAYSSFSSTPSSLNDPAVAAAAAAAYLNSYNGYGLHHTYPNSHHHQHAAYNHHYHSHLNATPGMLNGAGQFSSRYGCGDSSSFYSPIEDNPENNAQLNSWYNSQVDTRIASKFIFNYWGSNKGTDFVFKAEDVR